MIVSNQVLVEPFVAISFEAAHAWIAGWLVLSTYCYTETSFATLENDGHTWEALCRQEYWILNKDKCAEFAVIVS